MPGHSWALQKALYEQLQSIDEATSYFGQPPSVLDAVAFNSTYPLVVIGETKERPLPGVDDAYEHEIRIYIFSRYDGMKEVKNLTRRIYLLLHDARFDTNDFHLANLRLIFSDVFKHATDGVMQGTMRFRAVTEDKKIKQSEATIIASEQSPTDKNEVNDGHTEG